MRGVDLASTRRMELASPATPGLDAAGVLGPAGVLGLGRRTSNLSAVARAGPPPKLNMGRVALFNA